MRGAGVTGEAVEDGETLYDNALKKVRFVFDRLIEKAWVMSDDTGLFIDALNGLPGVNTAYWAGKGKAEKETMMYALEQMRDIADRRATFKTSALLMSPEGSIYHFEGSAPGKLLHAPRLAPQPKMPYSSIFEPDEGGGKVWAEMSVDEENEISHRGKAFRQVIGFFASRVDPR